MSIELFLYLVDVLRNCTIICETIFYLSLITIGVTIFILSPCNSGISFDDDENTLKKFLLLIKSKLWAFFILIFLLISVPSEKTMYLIAGAHYLKKSDIPSKVEIAINKKLNEYLDYNEEEKD